MLEGSRLQRSTCLSRGIMRRRSIFTLSKLMIVHGKRLLQSSEDLFAK
jgi:hypothetical protein